MESLLVFTAHYHRLLLITAQYFLLKSLLLIGAHHDYYRLLPNTAITVHYCLLLHEPDPLLP
jgi:hypothetical protein